MTRSLLGLSLLIVLPLSLHGQSGGPAIGIGYGVTQSRMNGGEAISLQASVPLRQWKDVELRGESLYQWGHVTGARCERLGSQYCIGSSDRNQILGLGAALQLALGNIGPIGVTVPVGGGLYHRRTASTESEGPIGICVEGNQIVACPGNPPLQSVDYRTHATVAGYSVGIGFSTTVRRVGFYVEARGHSLVERNSRAGALPLSVGIRL